jgi:hypothetical protein
MKLFFYDRVGEHIVTGLVNIVTGLVNTYIL